ncbi:unnamed protein product [Notodromas monacha]|uniref:BUD13 homolog n=1 Tax=Notodromas monacha TaxID=399045 RepID=A0A7R9BFY8_9CRUS|nr:unnamed protein product [Notodromas monacha]CAG0913394.1 unnamed protein product [Notodromas monacha]
MSAKAKETSSVIDQKEYLKKYLGLGADGAEKKKKKKKKQKHAVITSRCKIVDDDGLAIQDVVRAVKEEDDIDEIFATADELPTFAGLTDDLPVELRTAEYQNSSRWARVGRNTEEDVRTSWSPRGTKRSIAAVASSPPRSSRIRHDSDASPPRNLRIRHDSDASPPRQSRTRHDSDASPPRNSRTRHDSDASPPRQSRKRHDSDASPPRNSRKRHDSDASPPRQSRQRHDSDASPPRNSRTRFDSDASPPRNSRTRTRHDSDASPPRQSRMRHDSDASPPRNPRARHDSDASPRRATNDSDASPPRRRSGNDSDASPPRKRSMMKMDFPKIKSERRSNSPPGKDSLGRRTKTMDGKKAGLQSKETLRRENAAFAERQRAAIVAVGIQRFVHLYAADERMTGKGAKTVVRRDRKVEEKLRKKQEKADRRAVIVEKYKEFNVGIATTKQKEQQISQDLYEMSKPLARYADDEDLERQLKEQERADDPMLEYVRRKKMEKFKEANPNYVERPKYKPPPQPPINRFNVWPGYRWDGVDRSNGFENEFFAKQASRKAGESEAYKWSTEDM